MTPPVHKGYGRRKWSSIVASGIEAHAVIERGVNVHGIDRVGGRIGGDAVEPPNTWPPWMPPPARSTDWHEPR